MSDWEDAGWEDAEGWESASSPSFMPQSLKDAYGGVEAAGSMLLGLPGFIGSGYAGLGDVLLGKGGASGGNTVEEFQKKFMPQPKSKEGQEVMQALGTGMEALKEKGHGDNPALNSINDFAIEMATNMLPIPGGKGVRKLGTKIEETFKKPEPIKHADGWEDAPVPEVKPEAEQPWVQRQLELGEQMNAREQKFADMNNIQGELDMRPPQRGIVDENGMPVDMARSLDAQEARVPEQMNLLDEEALARTEFERTHRDEQMMEAQRDIAYGQKQQAEAMQGMVKQLQDKFHVPRSQRGAVDMEAFRGLFNDKAIESAKNLEPNEVIVKMTPKMFHELAESRSGDFKSSPERRASIEKGLKEGGLDDLPYLKGVMENGEFKVEAHNGRHRMDVLQERGVQEVPVRLRAWRGEGKPTEATPIRGQNIKVPRSQRGAVDFEGVTEGLRKMMPRLQTDVPAIKNIVGKEYIPADPKPADVVSKALAEGKDTNSWNVTKYTASGSSLEAMTRKSDLVQGISRIVQNAQKRADLYIQKTVFPMERQLRQMSTKDIVKVADVLKNEMLGKELYTVEKLQEMGLNEAQMKAYANHRQLMENTLAIQNKARAANGLKPVDGKEYYTSSRWHGDFRQPVRDKEGKLVWYLAADSEMGLKSQLKALQKKHPDLVAKPAEAHRVRNRGYNQKSDLQSMYSTMLDILGRDDPAVQKLREAYEEVVAAEASTTLGQQKHFERKANIRGYVGDRPGAKPEKEALAMLQEQVTYAKNAYKWSALQEAAQPIKEILGNEKLQEQQPKNVEYAQEYLKNALGHGEARWVSAMQDAFRDTGFSPNYVEMGVNGAKSFFITQKLGASLGYTMANMLQVMNTVPHLVDTMVKHGGNPFVALPVGMSSGIAMASGHYLNKAGGDFGRLTKDLPFFNEAFKYGEENGITSRSIYDESPITSRGPVATGLQLFGKTMTIPETYIRSAAYMTFVKMLKDSGKFTDNMEVFQKAEELTNASMVDYRASERPMGFSKMGIAGNALNTLQTFPANLYNQYRYFGKEAARGNVAPLIAMLTLQYAMAGAMGIPGFQDMDKMLTWAKGLVPDSMYMKVREFDPKLWLIENLGEAAVYGLVSTESGVNMTSRLSAPGGLDMIQAPGGPVMDIAKQAGSVANLATNPNETTFAQAARNVAPTGLQGYLETGPLKDQNVAATRPDGTTLYKKATDLADRQGQYARTPEEEKLRKLGLRSQKEVFSNDMAYKVGAVEQLDRERSKSVSGKYYDAIRRGDTKKAAELQKLYTQINGHPIEDRQVEEQMLEEFTTTIERKSIGAKERLNAIQGLARLKKIIKEREDVK